MSAVEGEGDLDLGLLGGAVDVCGSAGSHDDIDDDDNIDRENCWVMESVE